MFFVTAPVAFNPGLPSAHLLPDGGGVNPAEQLCLACGMCCDGTLFDGVQLEPGDDAQKLKTLGLRVSISRGKTPIARFPQPCTALCANRTCRLYADRPSQCRVFECGVLKEAKAGRITFTAATQSVKKARRQADKIRRLLHQLGDTEQHRALGERFFRMQCRMEEEPTDEATRSVFADLSLAVHRLKLLSHDKFYTRPPAT